jgi:hypothetical protein
VLRQAAFDRIRDSGSDRRLHFTASAAIQLFFSIKLQARIHGKSRTTRSTGPSALPRLSPYAATKRDRNKKNP